MCVVQGQQLTADMTEAVQLACDRDVLWQTCGLQGD
jgi:hypothetical protein